MPAWCGPRRGGASPERTLSFIRKRARRQARCSPFDAGGDARGRGERPRFRARQTSPGVRRSSVHPHISRRYAGTRGFGSRAFNCLIEVDGGRPDDGRAGGGSRSTDSGCRAGDFLLPAPTPQPRRERCAKRPVRRRPPADREHRDCRRGRPPPLFECATPRLTRWASCTTPTSDLVRRLAAPIGSVSRLDVPGDGSVGRLPSRHRGALRIAGSQPVSR